MRKNLKSASYICTAILFIGCLCTVLFWHYEILLTVLLALLVALKHVYAPIKKELVWFCFVAVMGPILENIIIISGAWDYPQHSLLFVPLWLPMLWGLAATSAVPIYLSFINRKTA